MKKSTLFSVLFIFVGIALYSQPTISSFAPLSAPVGATVTILGTNFNPLPANNIVHFGTTRATVSSASATSLDVVVPVGASNSKISVTNIVTSFTAYSILSFNISFLCSDNIIASSFAPGMQYTAGSGIRDIAVGDFNNDGIVDLATVNNSANSFSILRGTSIYGVVSFAPKVDFTTGAGPFNLAVGDLDGDGMQDIIVANNTANTVSVFRNISSGSTITFAAKVDFATGASPKGAAIGDIDKDGKPDIAVTSSTANTVSVFRNIGSVGIISFAPKVDFTSASGPYYLSIADFDMDGKVDIVSGNYISPTLSLFLNTSVPGTISFLPKVDISAPTVHFMAVNDIDGDGLLDVITANGGGNSLSVFRNISTIGSITFAPRVNFTTGNDPRSVSISDLNGDGKPDMVSMNYSSSTMTMLKNTSVPGTVTMLPKVDHNNEGAGFGVVVCDLDLDSKPEIITTNQTVSSANVFSNDLCNEFPPVQITSITPKTGPAGTVVNIIGNNFSPVISNNTVFFGSTKGATSFASIDSMIVTVPSNTMLDYVTVLNSVSKTAGSSLTHYSESFSCPDSLRTSSIDSAMIIPSSNYSQDIFLGDIDGDGNTDVLNGYNGGFSVLRNISSGVLIQLAPRVNFSTSTGPVDIVSGDIDGDGMKDIILSNYSPSTISILRNTSTPGSISFAPKIDISILIGTQDLAIADLNQDGRPEIIISSGGATQFTVLQNTSFPGIVSFNYPKVFTIFGSGADAYGISAGDIDGDGKVDVIVTDKMNYTMQVLRNTTINGYMTFAPSVFFTAPLLSKSLKVGDIDGDGKLDVFTANSNSVSVFRNLSLPGSISFATRIDLATETATGRDCFITDMNGDTKLDLIVNSGNNFSYFENLSSPGNLVFGSRIDRSTSFPRGIAAGDLNSDGKPDIVVANYSTTSSTLSVYRNLVGAPISTSISNDTICSGDNLGIILTASAPSIFSWFATDNINTGGENTMIQSTSTISDQINNFSGTTQTVTYSVIPVSTGGCGGGPIQTINALINPEPIIIANASNDTICTGGVLTLSGSGGTTYVWDNSVVDGIPFSPIADTTYHVTSSNSFGCIGSDSVIVYVDSVPLASISSSGPLLFCLGDSVLLTGISSDNFIWSTGDTNVVISVLNTGAYSVYASNLCGTDTVTLNVFVNPLPSIPTITQVDSVLISTTSSSYDWLMDAISTGTATQSFLPLQNGSYSVLVTDTNGCSSSSAQFVFKFVWPGDADNDSIVSNSDLLPLGIFYSQTGPTRSTFNNSWQAFASADWNTNQINGEDIKHIDCNGDGIINSNDTIAINLNFSSIHTIGLPVEESRLLDPSLYLTSSSSTYVAGAWVDIDVMAGTSSLPINDLYGLAFDINYDASLVEPLTEVLFYPISWLSIPGVNGISLGKVEPLMNTAFGALTRIDHFNADGYGKIGTFRFQVKNSLAVSSSMNFSFSGYTANDSAGNNILLNPGVFSVTLNPLSTDVNGNEKNGQVRIYPNPSSNSYSIMYTIEKPSKMVIQLYNLLGEKVEDILFTYKSSGTFTEKISWKDGHPAGSYILKISVDDNEINQLIIRSK